VGSSVRLLKLSSIAIGTATGFMTMHNDSTTSVLICEIKHGHLLAFKAPVMNGDDVFRMTSFSSDGVNQQEDMKPTETSNP